MDSRLVAKGTTARLAVIGVCGALGVSSLCLAAAHERSSGTSEGSVSVDSDAWTPVFDMWLQWLMTLMTCRETQPDKAVAARMVEAVECYWASGIRPPTDDVDRQEMLNGLSTISALLDVAPPSIDADVVIKFKHMVGSAIRDVGEVGS